MDEETEKPFPIEFIIILLIVAIVNDVAEIFFDLLDFTGVGIAGEAIMEPANVALDFFFTGIFWWKVGPGGGTITQYIGDILEPLLIPGRTISVGLGMWISNHPNSIVSKAATAAVSAESGNVGGAKTETLPEPGRYSRNNDTGDVYENDGNGKSKVVGNDRTDDWESNAHKKSTGGATDRGEPNSPGSDGGGEGEKTSQEKDIFKNPYENPVGTAAEELNAPPEEEFHEGELAKQEKKSGEETPRPKKDIDISNHPDYQRNNQSRKKAA